MMDSHRDEIAKLEALYASNPEGRVFTHLAEACRKAGQLERAREILDEGLKRHPDYASAHVVLGRVLIDAGDENGSTAEFRRVLELDRHNLVALRSLGDLASKGGRPDEALYYYGELAVLDPTDLAIQEEMRRLREQGAAVDRIDMPDWAASAGPKSAGGGTGTESAAEPGAAEPGAAEPSAAAEAAPPASMVEDAEPEATGSPDDQPATAEIGTEDAGEAGGPADEPALALERDETSFADIDVDALSSDVGLETFASSFEPMDIGGGLSAVDLSGLTLAEEDAGDAAAGGDAPVDEAGAAAEPPDDGGHTDAATWQGVEGRWDAPEPRAADDDAERERTATHDKGEWIPQDRWNWVSASDGQSNPPAAAADEDEVPELAEPDEPTEPSPTRLDSEESQDTGSPEFGDAVEMEAAVEETIEVIEAEIEITAETPRPVDSFEEGAMEVLQASGLMDGPDASEGPGEEDELAVAYGSGSSDAPDEDSGDQVITETLAEIYASQGLVERAVSVYRRLVRTYPEDDRLQTRLTSLEASLSDDPGEDEDDPDGDGWLERVESAFTGGQGVVTDEASPYAWSHDPSDDADAGPRIGDYFRSLLAWRPTAPAPPPAPSPAPAPLPAAPAPVMEAPELPREEPRVAAEPEWSPPPAASDDTADASESDEDLEMFRSWLKSLKK